MGQAQALTADRREIRRTVGQQTLDAMDRIGAEHQALRQELRVQIGRVHLILGKTTDADLGRPMMFRLDLLEAQLSSAVNAQLALAAQQAAINHSFWTRLRWLLSGL